MHTTLLREELAAFQYWINREQFDRRAVNRRLQQYAVGDEAWQWQERAVL